MTALERPRRDVPESLTDDAAATAPRIVNGLTVRPRKRVNPWLYGLLLPDFAALLVIVGLGMHRLLRYLDTTGKKQS